MNESIEELKRLHLLSKPELKKALINIENIIKNHDGEAALFSVQHLSDAIISYDEVTDRLFAEIESKNEKLAIAVKSLEWYADERAYTGSFSPKGNGIQEPPIVFDGGERARQAIQKAREAK